MAGRNGHVQVIQVLQENQRVMRLSIDKQTETLAALTQKVSDIHDRLYGPDGVILRLTNSVTSLGKTLVDELKEESAFCRTDRATLTERVQKVEARSIWITASAGGFGTAIGLFGKYVFGKLLGH
jgi:hypothetical protein